MSNSTPKKNFAVNMADLGNEIRHETNYNLTIFDRMTSYLREFYEEYRQNEHKFNQYIQESERKIEELTRSIENKKNELEKTINEKFIATEKLKEKIEKDLEIIGTIEGKMEQSFQEKYDELSVFESKIQATTKKSDEQIEQFKKELNSLKPLLKLYEDLKKKINVLTENIFVKIINITKKLATKKELMDNIDKIEEKIRDQDISFDKAKNTIIAQIDDMKKTLFNEFKEQIKESQDKEELVKMLENIKNQLLKDNIKVINEELNSIIEKLEEKYNSINQEHLNMNNNIQNLTEQFQLMQNNNNNFVEIINKFELDLSLNTNTIKDFQEQIKQIDNKIKNISNDDQLKGIRESITKIDEKHMELISGLEAQIKNLSQKSHYEALQNELKYYKDSQSKLIDGINKTLGDIQRKQFTQAQEIENIKQILGKYQNPDQIEQEIKKILNSTTVINTVVQENRELKDKIKRLENKIEEYYHRMESKGVDFENLESEVQKQRNILLLLTKSHTNDLFMRSNYTF